MLRIDSLQVGQMGYGVLLSHGIFCSVPFIYLWATAAFHRPPIARRWSLGVLFICNFSYSSLYSFSNFHVSVLRKIEKVTNKNVPVKRNTCTIPLTSSPNSKIVDEPENSWRYPLFFTSLERGGKSFRIVELQ